MPDNTSFTPAEIERYYAARVPGLKKAGSEWRGGCPIHQGNDDNFAVEPDSGRWYCHSQCGRGGAILELEKELSSASFPEAKAEVYRIVGRALELMKQHRGGKTGLGSGDGWRKVAEYIYQDEAGIPLHKTVRKERGAGDNREKEFPQSRWEGGGWLPKVGDTRRVPYRLPKLAAAGTIYIVEGEKDVATLEVWGLVATCNPGGSGSTRLYQEWANIFAGKHLVILPDNDRPGRKHAAGIAEALIGAAASIRVVELPGLAEKGDVSDWTGNGGSVGQFLELVEHAVPVDPEGLAALRVRWGLMEEKKADEPVKPKSPFQVTEHGVFWLKPDAEGGVEPLKLSARLDVVADTRDAAGENWGRLLRWWDRDMKPHEWSMPLEMLATDSGAVRARLMDSGLPYLVTNQRLREKFAEYLQGYPVEARLRCVPRIGWHGGSYVLPDFIAGASESESLVYQPGSGAAHQWNTRGTVAEWWDAIGRKCSGNSRLLLAVSCGFAGPLLVLAGAESGGIHIFGGTSTGKSTALFVGASVCGGGDCGFVQSWRSTLNGLEAIAEGHDDATLFLDELAQVDAREAADIAYMLGNGQGKVRMSKGLTARERLTWQLLFVSAGEITLADHAASAGKRTRGGVEARLLNVEADAGSGMGLFEELHGTDSPDRFSGELKDAARRFYGSPFRAFLTRLVESRAESEEYIRRVRETAKQGWVPADAAGEVTRAADRFAIIGAAGELASRWGITGWAEKAALAAALRCFRDWLRWRGTAGSSDRWEGVRQVRVFIETHGASRFQDCATEEEPGKTINRAGFVRKDGPESQYLILPGPFKDEVCRGFDHRAVAKELAARGFLRCDPGRNMVKPRLPGLGTTWVYCIRETIMQFDDTGSD